MSRWLLGVWHVESLARACGEPCMGMWRAFHGHVESLPRACAGDKAAAAAGGSRAAEAGAGAEAAAETTLEAAAAGGDEYVQLLKVGKRTNGVGDSAAQIVEP
ncbi:unnamed protein product [Closterium sp. NIES-53]